MKRKGLLAGILLLILMLLCSCGASEEAKEIDAQLQEQQAGLAQAEAAYLEAVGEGEHLALPYLWSHRNSACLCSGGEGTGTLQIWYFGRYGSFGALSTPDACG